MATEDLLTQNGLLAANGSNGNFSAAQRLLQKHSEEVHKATMEEVPDEDDLKHNEEPKSSSIIEAADEVPSAPTWAQPMSAKSAGKQAQDPLVNENRPPLDTQSHDLFPKLGGAPKPQSTPAVASIWGAKKPGASISDAVNGKVNGQASPNGTSRASTPLSGTPVPSSPMSSAPARPAQGAMTIPGRHTERISISPAQLLPRAQMKKPVADVVKEVNKKSKATIAMSTGAQGLMWFTATGPFAACRQALQDLCAQICSKLSVTVPIPRSARAHIIGKQGSTIKALQEKCGARIHMPKLDDSTAPVLDDDDATVDVLIEGNALTAGMAQNEILKLVAEKTVNASYKLRNIPAEFYPFIAGPHNERVQALEEGKNVRVHVPVHHTWTPQPPPLPGAPLNFAPPANDKYITLSGDRLAVQEIRSEIERQVEGLRRQLVLEQLSINKGRHQFIIGERGIPIHEFLADTGCAIFLPENSDEEMIAIVGPSDRVPIGVEKAVDLASSMNSTNVDISRFHRNVPCGAATHARNVTRYLQKRREIQRLEKLYNAHIVTSISPEGGASWELYARDSKNMIRAQSEISSIISGHPPSRIASVEVDPFFHQHLRNDISPRVHQNYGVNTVIPDDTDATAPVLLVVEGPSGLDPHYQVPRTQPTASEIQSFQQALDDATNYIIGIINSQEQITSQAIDVPQKFHEKLRKFIKKEQQDRSVDQIPVRVTASGTTVTLRGPSTAVELLVKKVSAFIAQEVEDEKERGFTMSFDFPQKHANQLIGKGGSNIRELRERFDVEIQVDNGKVELKGPPAKAEAAKSHIIALGKHWADEVAHILKIEPKYHRELIGAQGSQINRLQTRYKVQIHFPHSARPVKDNQSVTDGTSEAGHKGGRRVQAEDEVVVRGPSKGAAEARDEILSLLQYLKDNSYSATVTVQQSQVPSLIGQGGKAMDELRQLTGAKVDIPRDANPAGQTEITIKGTKTQVAQARKFIEEKKLVFDQNISRTLEVDKKHHGALIGPRGSIIRDIFVKAGGSDDPKELTRSVKFPREGEGNLIKFEGNKNVVDKVIDAIQAIVAQRESQVVETVDIPTEKHRSLVGRGGETRKALETKFNVTIEIPRLGNGQTGVRITGQPTEVETAKEHILGLVKEEEGETVNVPKNLHHATADNGHFFRKLRKDYQVTVDHAGHKIPSKSAVPSNTRAGGGALPLITDDQATLSGTFSWNVVSLSGSDVDGEIPWVLYGSPENVAKAKTSLTVALEQARKNTHTGYLVLSDPQTYRYVVGQGGSKVNSIRKASGCKITVPKDQAKDEAIEITGNAEGVEKAKELVLQAVREGGNARNGNRT